MRGNNENTRANRQARHRWSAIGGTLLFVAIGLALAPGLAHFERAPAAKPPPAQPGPEVEAARPIGVAPDVAPERAADRASPAPDAALSINAFECMILPSETIEVGSSIEGRIEAIEADRSDYVEADQVLVRLESAVEEAAVRVAEARAAREADTRAGRVSLALGKKRKGRASRLFDNSTISLDLRDEVETETRLAAVELDRAIENRRIAGLELEQARAALARRTIRSPVSGYVVERLMSAGEVVDEETILRVVQVDPLRVEAILPSAWFGRVEAGDLAEVVPEASRYPARTAQVSIVDPVIDGASGTFGARLTLPNPGHDLPAGLRCQLLLLKDPAMETATPAQTESVEDGT